ncbi:MAG: hypothetical protein ACFFCU_03260 [Promethearchaeota archaeon]
MRFKSGVIVNFLIILIIWSSGCTEPKKSQETELIVMGVTGESREFTLMEIKELPNIDGTSEHQNSLGDWSGKGVYKGVSISVFAEEVGGMQPGDILLVTSEDNYVQVFSYTKIYPSTEWDRIQGSMILAYSYNGTLFPDWTEGYRIVFLPKDHAYSNADCEATSPPREGYNIWPSAGFRWLKFVRILRIRNIK